MIGLSKTRLRAILPEKINGGTEWITALLVNQCFPRNSIRARWRYTQSFDIAMMKSFGEQRGKNPQLRKL